MNNKQTILKILDKHRDMSLTMGCELVKNHSGYMVVNSNSFDGKIGLLDESKNTYFEVDREVKGFIRIGHKPTPLTLLKALEANHKPIEGRRETRTYHINGTYTVAFVDDITQESGVYEIQIPDVTTLTELPHTHQLWTDLLPILS